MKDTVKVTRLEENTYCYSFMKDDKDFSYTIKFDESVVGFLLDKFDGNVLEAEDEMHDQVVESLLKMVE
jgi:hypothetical protein